jgi:DNA-binding HxlR family transcriptional regulator
MVMPNMLAGNRAQYGWVATFWLGLLMPQRKKILATKRSTQGSGTKPSVKRMLEDIIGCKWSLTVLSLVRRGVHRPGKMEHAINGLSAKVLNERLRKLTRFGLLDKRSFAEIPPRVEYRLTPMGVKLGAIIDQIEKLESD